MKKYQDVDNSYNKMFIANSKFNTKYDTKVSINDRVVGMNFSDIRYGQRSLEKHSKNQEMLNLGDNSISLEIVDKKSKAPIRDANISFQITRPIKNDHDINLNSFNYSSGKYTTNSIKLDLKGHWNIIGKVIVGNDVGYLYIKTATKE